MRVRQFAGVKRLGQRWLRHRCPLLQLFNPVQNDVVQPVRSGRGVSALKHGVLRVMIGVRLEHMSKQQELRFAEQLSGHVERCRRAPMEAARHAEGGMPGAVRERKVEAEVEG